MARDTFHLFKIHHILPNELFKDKDIQKELKALFGDDYLALRDSEANKIALYRHVYQAEMVRESLSKGESFMGYWSGTMPIASRPGGLSGRAG
ncbi:hypothetical protein [Modicisalibacter coralii]|uniref:hypothetical protein n=1 Tax=Modicisalibacter coralii TaxID=2304602 RepID=UPI00100AF570|nr:hypothetical protein [Halomonas coralii]